MGGKASACRIAQRSFASPSSPCTTASSLPADLVGRLTELPSIICRCLFWLPCWLLLTVGGWQLQQDPILGILRSCVAIAVWIAELSHNAALGFNPNLGDIGISLAACANSAKAMFNCSPPLANSHSQHGEYLQSQHALIIQCWLNGRVKIPPPLETPWHGEMARVFDEQVLHAAAQPLHGEVNIGLAATCQSFQLATLKPFCTCWAVAACC